MNILAITGRKVDDGELRYTASGNAVHGFTLAVDDGFGDSKRTYFIECVAWKKQAETIAEHIKKGQMVGIEGKLTTRNWEDKNGNKRKSTEVLVTGFQFLDTKKSENKQDPFKHENIVDIDMDSLPF